MQKITPCLWFNDNAEKAVQFYTSIFRKSKVGRITRYDKAGERVSGRPAGSVMTIDFRIEGQDFTALNGGPIFKFNEAVSFVINCRTQREVDYYWRKLTANGGKEQPCGWLKDKFGVSWQVVPTALNKLMNSRDPAKRQRVMEAMLKMGKLDVKKLEKAASGREMTVAAKSGKTIDGYLAGIGADQRASLQGLRKTIKAAAPGAEEGISYGLPAFKLNGHPLVAFGASANHCSFYPMSPAVISKFKKQLAGFSMSKGTVRFTTDKPIPATLVKNMVKARIEESRRT